MWTILAAMLFDSFMTTSKAPLIVIGIVYLLYKEIVHEKISKVIFAVLIFLVFATFYYSYYTRYFGESIGKINIDTALNNAEMAYYNKENILSITSVAFFNRIELFDNLIYTMKKSDQVKKGYYTFGSVAELLNLVPHAILKDRPFLYFDYFVVENILVSGLKGVSSSIGKIGESFFVLGYFGLTLSIIYAFIYFYLYYFLVYTNITLSKLLIYLNLYFLYFLNDNYFFQNIVVILYLSLFIILMNFFFNTKIKK